MSSSVPQEVVVQEPYPYTTEFSPSNGVTPPSIAVEILSGNHPETFVLQGRTEAGNAVIVGKTPVSVSSDGTFNQVLRSGLGTVTISVTNPHGISVQVVKALPQSSVPQPAMSQPILYSSP